jgi:uracil-DNA glycosylase family 4
MMDENISQEWQKFDRTIVECQLCTRLVQWREEIAQKKRKAYREQEYWGKPVPGFGDHKARVLVVGLAPGAHGSNRTGRMFTGDASGIFLYSTLYRAGFANQSSSIHREDGLMLKELFISALCRCVPPANKPVRQEICNCRQYLKKEIELLKDLQGFIALGQMAFENLLLIYKEYYRVKLGNEVKFRHGAIYEFDHKVPWLLASYHPSQQNTQTGKLTQAMFDTIWVSVRKLLL